MSFPTPFYRWRPHPWHGLEVGPDPPRIVNGYIELTSFDLMKYEIDKVTGYLRVDRPQRTSSQPPTLYGFIPRTFGGERVSSLSPQSERGDRDPLDICVVSERPIARPEVIVSARVVGGLQVIDGGEADDKIIAILDQDLFWGEVADITELPEIIVERLSHYFETYKLHPGDDVQIRIEQVYGAEYARKVVEAGIQDYEAEFGS
jgi:inorganic pyrophosphatase